MEGLVSFIDNLWNLLFSIIGIDFSSYTGSLPSELIQMYGYFEIGLKYIVCFMFLYLCFNFIVFLVSLGDVRHE